MKKENKLILAVLIVTMLISVVSLSIKVQNPNYYVKQGVVVDKVVFDQMYNEIYNKSVVSYNNSAVVYIIMNGYGYMNLKFEIESPYIIGIYARHNNVSFYYSNASTVIVFKNVEYLYLYVFLLHAVNYTVSYSILNMY